MSLTLQDLEETHKISKERGKYKITLNIDVNEFNSIYVLYNPFNGEIKIINEKLPESIKNHMLKYSSKSIGDFIHFIEDNSDKFLKNELPVEKNLYRNNGKNKKEEKIEINSSAKNCVKLTSGFHLLINPGVNANLFFERFVENILCLATEKLNVKIKCKRCQTLETIEKTTECIKCQAQFLFTYVPSGKPETLGFLSIKNADIVCFEPNKYCFACENCGVGYITKPIEINEKFKQTCFNCNKLMQFCIQRIFVINQSQQKGIVIKQGQELPRKGACSHYAKSNRWFRFPCCNSLFPCDICHDKEMNHKSVLANKMVCGLCSKEQSVKNECSCGMSLKRKHTKFWEGGKGNRDKSTMSRKDDKKFKK